MESSKILGNAIDEVAAEDIAERECRIRIYNKIKSYSGNIYFSNAKEGKFNHYYLYPGCRMSSGCRCCSRCYFESQGSNVDQVPR